MNKLYELNAEMNNVWEQIEKHAQENEGEIPNYLDQIFGQLSKERDQKILNVAGLIKLYESELRDYKREIKKINEWKNTTENKIDSIKNWLSNFLKPKEVVKNSNTRISWRTSEKVICDNANIAEFDEELLLPAKDRSPNLKKLKEMIKNREDVPEGVELKKFNNIQIK